MTPKAPRVEAGKVLRVLRKAGFEEVRASGSHRILRHPNGRRVTVPFHAGHVLHPKLLRSILDESGLDPEAFRRALR